MATSKAGRSILYVLYNQICMIFTAYCGRFNVLKKKQTGSVKITMLLAAVLVTVVLIGRHISSTAASAQVQQTPTQAMTSTKKKAVVSNECTNNSGSKLVLVSISSQHMWACQGIALVNQSAVTTGASNAPNGVNDGTLVGTWHIYEKFRNLNLKGSDKNGPWDDYVQYWMPFDTAIGFHDASWQTFPFGSSQYKTSGSHGCVQLPTGIAAWLYAWAPIGTKVVVKA